jgi:hypothetical protein
MKLLIASLIIFGLSVARTMSTAGTELSTTDKVICNGFKFTPITISKPLQMTRC